MTRKIGRYEILGPLASGGMAEILLARLVGPSGFERPVVIKRIRPDLDHDKLESLFLEEARLAAKVRHANVVAVEDLGTDEGVPYIVMEYLEGESLSNVTRRLKARDQPMPFGVITFILAEACAGLHAAHELRDGQRELVGLVHRDVSPHNVFVTYDGAVKVVDFGIAGTQKSAAAVPTEIRGKSGYMSPEQIQGEVVDRRTDVFALGIVLYELATGHRLFKRFNQTATTRAVLSDPILRPTRVEPTVPAALEAICMRALARPRESRYSTAAEMRRDLLVALRDLASEEPSAELAELMTSAFPDRIDDKQVLLRSVREGSIVDRIPVGDVDVTIEIPCIQDLPLGPESAPAASAPAPAAPAEPAPAAPAALAALAAPALLQPVPAPREGRRMSFVGWVGLALVALGGTAAGVRIVQSRTTVHASEVPVPLAVAQGLASRPLPAPADTVSSAPPVESSSARVVPSAVPVGVAPAPPPPLARPRAASATGAAARPAIAAPSESARPVPSASSRGFRRFQ